MDVKPAEYSYGAPCPTWTNPECQNGLARPAMLTTIQTLADAAHLAGTIPPSLYQSISSQIAIYMSAQNCLGTVNDGPGDCCMPGVSNCNCIQGALSMATLMPTPNWIQCNTRLQQGH